MLFKSIIGQDELIGKIQHQLSAGKFNHASLLIGESGYGALPIALAIAQFLNCETPISNDSCGNCAACIKSKKLIHPDLHISFPVATTTEVKKHPVSNHFISQWREVVLENPFISFSQWFEVLGVEKKQGNISADESNEILKQSALKPFEGNFKVFVIWLADKMNASAANKLLKVIEEPPAKTIFLLTAESSENMLATILSRVQMFKVPRIKDADIAEKLISIGTNEGAVDQIVQLADGSWSEAKKLAGIEGGNDFYFSAFTEWTRLCYKVKMSQILIWVENMSTIGREKQKNFFTFSLNILRECLLQNYHVSELSKLSGEEAAFKNNFAPFINNANAMDIIDEISKASYHIERNGNPKVIFLDLSLKVIQLLKIKSVTL